MRRRDVIAALPAPLTGCLLLRPDDGAGPTTETTPPDAETPSEAGSGGSTPTAPQVEWGFDQDAPRAPVTVRHLSGDAVTRQNTARLGLVVTTRPDRPVPTDVTITPTRTPTTHRTTWSDLSTEAAYPIEAGDSVALTSVTPGDEVTVRWYRSTAHEGADIGSTTLPKES